MRIVRYLVLFIAWNLALSAAILLIVPPLGALVAIALGVLLIEVGLLRRGPGASRRIALMRLRPLAPPVLRWVLLGVPVFLLLAWAVGDLYLRMVPVPPESLDPFGDVLEGPMGELSLALLAIGIAPVLEELFFRGLIQRTLELRYGPVVGIGVGAALFAAIHVLPWVFPLHFFLGCAFGFAVYAARSIWAGVMLHAANNAVAVIGLGVRGDDPAPTPTLWEIGLTPEWWTSVTLLAASAATAVWVSRKLWSAARGPRTFGRPLARSSLPAWFPPRGEGGER